MTLLSLVFVGCVKERSKPKKSKPPTRSTPHSNETNDRDTAPDQIPTRVLVSQADTKSLPSLKPTTYFIAREENVNCRGKYRANIYNGSEITELKDVNGAVLAEVCTRFYKVLLMEGTAVLRDRGLGEFTLNYARKVNGTHRFREMDKCVYGEGVQKNLCLIPFHTLAADRKAYDVGDVVFMPAAVDLVLPDGSLHDGFFLVRDTGGAFTDKGLVRVDMFVGFQADHDNVFLNAGFHRQNPQEAYKIVGESAELVKERLRFKFPDIY